MDGADVPESSVGDWNSYDAIAIRSKRQTIGFGSSFGRSPCLNLRARERGSAVKQPQCQGVSGAQQVGIGERHKLRDVSNDPRVRARPAFPHFDKSFGELGVASRDAVAFGQQTFPVIARRQVRSSLQFHVLLEART